MQIAVIITNDFFFCSVVNATPSESRRWIFTADYRTGFTVKMRMEVTLDLILQPYFNVARDSSRDE